MRKVAVVAAGQTPYGSFPGQGLKKMFLDAFEDAVESAEGDLDYDLISEAYIGNLGVGGSQLGNPAALLVEHIGLEGVSARRVENACASSGFALRDAVMAVRNGADMVIAGGIEIMNDLPPNHQKYWLGVSGDTEWERTAGATFAGIYALMARRHMHEYGTPREALAACAVKNHKNAVHNPHAQFRKEVTLDRVMNAPMVANPLGLFDCCPTSDGATFTVLASEEIARKLTDDPIWVTGSGAATDHLAIHDRETLTTLSATKKAARDAFKQAGIETKDVDLAEIHDCFTIAEVLALEDIGFFEKGEAARPIISGDTQLNAFISVNASGGLKAKGHPLGATGTGQIVELYKQLKGKAGKRQVQDAEIGIAHNVGGSGATCTVHVLRR